MTEYSVIDILSKLFKQKPIVQKGGEEILVFCPNCTHHKRKLNINTKTGYYQCWLGCGFNGKSFYSLLKKMKSSKDFYDILCKNKPKIVFSHKEEKILSLPDEFRPLCIQSDHILYKHALSYCIKRNISVYDILRYNIGYCESGKFSNRIIVPSYDLNAHLNFYCGRDIYNNYIKYRLCENTKDIIGFELFTNFDHELTLVEGVFDAITVKYNVIPLFGKTLSKKLKIKLINNKPPRVNVLLDNDALSSSLKICDFLIQNGINTYLILLNGKDPNDIGHNLTWKSIRSGVKMDESILYHQKMMNKYDFT